MERVLSPAQGKEQGAPLSLHKNNTRSGIVASPSSIGAVNGVATIMMCVELDPCDNSATAVRCCLVLICIELD